MSVVCRACSLFLAGLVFKQDLEDREVVTPESTAADHEALPRQTTHHEAIRDGRIVRTGGLRSGSRVILQHYGDILIELHHRVIQHVHQDKGSAVPRRYGQGAAGLRGKIRPGNGIFRPGAQGKIVEVIGSTVTVVAARIRLQMITHGNRSRLVASPRANLDAGSPDIFRTPIQSTPKIHYPRSRGRDVARTEDVHRGRSGIERGNQSWIFHKSANDVRVRDGAGDLNREGIRGVIRGELKVLVRDRHHKARAHLEVVEQEESVGGHVIGVGQRPAVHRGIFDPHPASVSVGAHNGDERPQHIPVVDRPVIWRTGLYGLQVRHLDQRGAELEMARIRAELPDIRKREETLICDPGVEQSVHGDAIRRASDRLKCHRVGEHPHVRRAVIRHQRQRRHVAARVDRQQVRARGRRDLERRRSV